MAFFPKIQSPCPYKSELASIVDAGFCGICRREVIDITAWTDVERVAFLGACKEEVCVSYRFVRPALAAAALAAAALPTAAAAQTQAPVETAAFATSDDMSEGGQEVVVTGGGITDPRNVEYLSEEELASTREAPVIYEDEEPKPGA